MNFVKSYDSSESDYTLCPSEYMADYKGTGVSLTQSVSKGSDRSSVTKFIRQINQATYIERQYDESEKALSDRVLEDFDNRTIHGLDEQRYNSPLSSSTTKVQHCQVLEDPEVVRKRQERYNEWLKKKIDVEKKRRLEQRASEERMQEQLRIKKKESQEKVSEWLNSKKRLNKRSNSSENLNTSNLPKRARGAPKESPRKQETSKAKRAPKKFDEWMRKKQEQELAELERKRQERCELERQKNYKSALANVYYRKWYDTSALKPRPPPLNRGFTSITSFTMPLYFNPDPWQPES